MIKESGIGGWRKNISITNGDKFGLSAQIRSMRLFQRGTFCPTVRCSLQSEKTTIGGDVAIVNSRKTHGTHSLDSLLKPKSVAVIGASRREGSIGNKIFDNLLEGPFQGPVFPVNPLADEISTVKAYPTILNVPEPVDLAVIVVPAEAVLDAAEQCGDKGVKSLIVISAGFAENGGEGF